MKCKALVLTLVLTIAGWAQTATPNAPPPTAPAQKANCACCAKMASADAKEGQSCARHMGQSVHGKEMASCCGDKNSKSCCAKNAAVKCMNDGKAAGCCSECNQDKMAASCCGSKDASTGAMDCGKGCCSGRNDKASKGCCRKMMQS